MSPPNSEYAARAVLPTAALGVASQEVANLRADVRTVRAVIWGIRGNGLTSHFSPAFPPGGTATSAAAADYAGSPCAFPCVAVV